MDPFYAFLIFILLLALDIFASQTWLGAYYRFGIPIYIRRVRPKSPLDPAHLISALEASFKSSPLNPSLRFRPVGGNAIAMRESLFENRTGLRYLPVFHTTLFDSADGSQTTITGFLNWYVLGTLLYIIYRTIGDSTYGVVAVLVVVIFLISYAGQMSVANRVGKAIEELTH